MGPLTRSVATLRISGDELVPEEVSALLGTQPTSSQRKGQLVPSDPTGTRTFIRGMWRLEATATEPGEVDTQVAELLRACTQDLGVWQKLAGRFKVDLFCGWFMGANNEGVELQPRTLLALGERGIPLSVDLYGPDA